MRLLSTFHADAVRIALRSIFAHKLRAFLTLIGIIIGVASVVVVGGAISGLNSYVTERISKILGFNHFIVARMAATGRISDEQWQRMDRRNKRITWREFEFLSKHCAACEEVGAALGANIDLKHGDQELLRTQIQGVTANMGQIEDKTIAEGRFLMPHEVERAASVCVIGMGVREKFFPWSDPVGKDLKIRGLEFRIVGVEAKRGSMLGQSLDNHVYIPVTTFGRIFGRRGSLSLHGLAASRAVFQDSIEQARVALRAHHKLKGNEDDDFGLINVEDVNRDVDQFTGAIAGVVTPITLISLVVGGIVVMNIMIVSVTERTFEIGLRKAVGAKKRQIMVQFLIESVLLCAMGGLLGLLAAAVTAWVIRMTTPIPMTITPGYVLLALLVSSVVGILAGLYPAYKAARLDPVIALTRTG
jgi:putative ABC transport system permease protein